MLAVYQPKLFVILVLLVYFKSYFVPPKERQSTDACCIQKGQSAALVYIYLQQFT
jgi:hypothetical protein